MWRLPWSRKPTPPAPPEPARPMMIRWAADAYIQATVVKAMVETHGSDEQFAMGMRPLLLEHAQKLIEILRGEVPAASGNVLKFARKK